MPPIKGGFAPKCRVLTANENPSSFETWKDALLFHLTLDGMFEFLLEDNLRWGAASTENRGFVASGTGVTSKYNVRISQECLRFNFAQKEILGLKK